MAFNSETARLAGKKSKRGPSKNLHENIRKKMEILYEDVLDHLIVHQEELSMSDRVKLIQSLSNYLLPKTKPIRDKFTLEDLREYDESNFMTRGPSPIE